MTMNKEQFITSLRKELKKLPPEEIVSATEYYEEYFAEAAQGAVEAAAAEGSDVAAAQAEAEARLIEEIGAPKAVAAQIKSEYASRILSGDETTLKYKQPLWRVIRTALTVAAAAVSLLALWFALAQWKKADSIRARIAQEKRKFTRNG